MIIPESKNEARLKEIISYVEREDTFHRKEKAFVYG